MTTLDERLTRYHQALVVSLEPQAQGLAPRAVRPRRTKLAVATVAAAVAAVAALLTVRVLPSGSPDSITIRAPGLTVVAAAGAQKAPHMTAAEARAIALASLSRDDEPKITGYTITTSTFVPGALRVAQQCGARIALPSPHDVWVIAFTAPPQGAWQFIRAAVLVDDASGWLLGGQILTGPQPLDGPLATCQWGT